MVLIELSNGMKLVAEQNTDPNFSKEIFIGISDGEMWYQDLAIIRPTYEFDRNGDTKWNDDEFEVLVYADKDDEDYTNRFVVGMYKGGI